MKNLSIKNYKNLKKLTINSLGKINLIVGKNNVGKSSLLEAIAIFASNGSTNYLEKILDIRGLNTKFGKVYDNFDLEDMIKTKMSNFASLYSDMDIEAFYKQPIEIFSDYQNIESCVSIEMVDIGKQRIIESDGAILTKKKLVEQSENALSFDSIIHGILVKYAESSQHLYAFDSEFNNSLGENTKIPFEYVLQFKTESNDNPRYFDKIALTILEKELIEALRIIEPNIQAINFLSNKGIDKVPMVVFSGDSARYQLSTMGDGINRVLTIILAMLNCENGIFLVDEFDSGLHYSVQTKLWKMVYHLAEKLNIQVFATTHSEDCIKSFIEANTKGLGKLIRLEKKGDEIVSVDYEEKDELAYIASSNIEVR